ncbi:hypothetical protein [uncultured Friedmanniella sp.]|uniref:hypothetical protein n=1 Tax=uncultured Friedmanniella sp. TaxID=335381 RepID=UPI0035CC1CB0
MPTAARRSPDRGAVRLARVAVLGGGSLLLATLAHVVAGGPLPAGWVLALSGLMLGVVAVTLTARRCRFLVLLGALTLQQVLLHLVFDAASLTRGCTPLPTAAAGHGAHLAAGAHAAAGATPHVITQTCGMAVGMASAALPGWAMWVAHLAATVLTAALLTRGEAWLWRTADRVVAVATAAPAERPRIEPATTPASRPRPARTRRLPRPAAPRGPPRVCLTS